MSVKRGKYDLAIVAVAAAALFLGGCGKDKAPKGHDWSHTGCVREVDHDVECKDGHEWEAPERKKSRPATAPAPGKPKPAKTPKPKKRGR